MAFTNNVEVAPHLALGLGHLELLPEPVLVAGEQAIGLAQLCAVLGSDVGDKLEVGFDRGLTLVVMLDVQVEPPELDHEEGHERAEALGRVIDLSEGGKEGVGEGVSE